MKTKKVKFSSQQLADWRRFEKVRAGGKYNMLFPQARAATGLSEERYSFTLNNYSELELAAYET